MPSMQAYCVKCKAKREMKEPKSNISGELNALHRVSNLCCKSVWLFNFVSTDTDFP